MDSLKQPSPLKQVDSFATNGAVMDNSMNKPELETLNRRPAKRVNKADNVSQPIEQPKCKTCEDTGKVPNNYIHNAVNNGTLGSYQPSSYCKPCPDCPEQSKRREGHSKLVYDKDTRTIKTVDPHPEQPNTNAMTIVSINGAIDVALNLLDQLRPKTAPVDDCLADLKSWKDNNFKPLRKAFE